MKYTNLFPASEVKKLEKLSDAEQKSRAGLVKFGSNVPLSIDVLERLDPLNYLLKMNGKKAFTESERELEPGMRYWGEVTHKRGEKLVVKSLIKQPDFFGEIKQHSLLNPKKVIEAFKNNVSDEFQRNFKKEVMNQMASTNNKEEFLFLNQLLLSMENNVISIPINYGDKSAMFQYQYGKNKKKQKTEKKVLDDLDFYAAFDLLGPMRGKIIYFNDETHLNLEVNFDTTREFLIQHSGEQEIFNNLKIAIKVIKDEIKPLYSFTQNNLLDLRT
jgi:hypothetical protein